MSWDEYWTTAEEQIGKIAKERIKRLLKFKSLVGWVGKLKLMGPVGAIDRSESIIILLYGKIITKLYIRPRIELYDPLNSFPHRIMFYYLCQYLPPNPDPSFRNPQASPPQNSLPSHPTRLHSSKKLCRFFHLTRKHKIKPRLTAPSQENSSLRKDIIPSKNPRTENNWYSCRNSTPIAAISARNYSSFKNMQTMESKTTSTRAHTCRGQTLQKNSSRPNLEIVQAPGIFNPISSPVAASSSQEKVIDRFDDYISGLEALKLFNHPATTKISRLNLRLTKKVRNQQPRTRRTHFDRSCLIAGNVGNGFSMEGYPILFRTSCLEEDKEMDLFVVVNIKTLCYQSMRGVTPSNVFLALPIIAEQISQKSPHHHDIQNQIYFCFFYGHSWRAFVWINMPLTCIRQPSTLNHILHFLVSQMYHTDQLDYLRREPRARLWIRDLDDRSSYLDFHLIYQVLNARSQIELESK